VVVYGPVVVGGDSWGLGVVRADSEADARTLAEADPAVSSGMATAEVGTMAVAIVPD